MYLCVHESGSYRQVRYLSFPASYVHVDKIPRYFQSGTNLSLCLNDP